MAVPAGGACVGFPGRPGRSGCRAPRRAGNGPGGGHQRRRRRPEGVYRGIARGWKIGPRMGKEAGPLWESLLGRLRTGAGVFGLRSSRIQRECHLETGARKLSGGRKVGRRGGLYLGARVFSKVSGTSRKPGESAMMRKGEGAPRPGELRPEARFTLASFRRHRTGERRHWPDVPPDGFDRPRRECRAGRRALLAQQRGCRWRRPGTVLTAPGCFPKNPAAAAPGRTRRYRAGQLS